MEALHIEHRRSALRSDQDVVAEVIAGGKGAYEILLRRYNQRLYRALRAYLHDEADVQDAMQETYLKAYQKLHQYKGDAAFSTWLVRIGINEALQHLRRAKKRSGRMPPHPEGDRLLHLPDTRMDPEHTAIHSETRRIVERAIDRLPEAYRAVYLLREVEGLPSTEVAACLGITEGNVKVRLHRAKALLKETVWEQLADAPAFEFGSAHCDLLVQRVMARIGA